MHTGFVLRDVQLTAGASERDIKKNKDRGNDHEVPTRHVAASIYRGISRWLMPRLSKQVRTSEL